MTITKVTHNLTAVLAAGAVCAGTLLVSSYGTVSAHRVLQQAGTASPSPSNTQTKNEAPSAKTEGQTLTPQERELAASYFKTTRQKFLESVAGLSEAQWKFKPAPESWSIAEVAEHIALSEETIFGLVTQRIMKSPAAPEKKEEARDKDQIVLKAIPDRSRKAQAPEMLKPTGRWTTQADLVKDFGASRDRTIAYVNETSDDLRSHFLPHPILKTLDAYQWLLLIAAHSERHTFQINEVKADPKFPKN